MPASQTKEEVDPVNCPICGGKETAPILYGLPLFDEELKRKLRDHRIVLGGCLVSPFDPQYHCFSCRTDFFDPEDGENRERNEELKRKYENRERSTL